MNKWIWFVVAIIAIFLIVAAGNTKQTPPSDQTQQPQVPANQTQQPQVPANQTQPSQEPISQPPQTQQYLLGVGYTQVNSMFTSASAWSKAKDIANVAYIQRNWKESGNTGNKNFYDAIKDDVNEARKNGLKIYLALEVLNYDRSGMSLPSDLSGDFTSADVRNAYIDTVKSVASDYKPDYFIINVEVNRYKDDNLASYNAYKELYKQAYDEVKAASPQTKIAISISLEDYNNKDCIDPEDLAVFKDFAADFEKQDVLAVSVYPNCYFDPKTMPETFLNDIAKLSQKPVFISETGRMSEGVSIPGFTYPSSQQAQADYIDQLSKAADYAVKKGKKIDTINYIALTDPDKAVCDSIKSIDASLAWYCTLALIQDDSTEKIGYGTFGQWKNRLAGAQ
ncbi:MAG: hypothetical protein AABX79_02405 [Nanoarchaeota archaeon]